MNTCVWNLDEEPCPRPARNRFACLCMEHTQEAQHRFSKARRRDRWNPDDFLHEEPLGVLEGRGLIPPIEIPVKENQ